MSPWIPVPLALAASLMMGAVAPAFAQPVAATEPEHVHVSQRGDTLIGLGLDGMECWCGGADNATVDRLLTLARRKGLIATGGSDFHQPGTGPTLGRGLGNLKGAFVGSLIVGILSAYGTLFFPVFELFFIFVIMAAVLLVRPQGLFAR